MVRGSTEEDESRRMLGIQGTKLAPNQECVMRWRATEEHWRKYKQMKPRMGTNNEW